MPQNELHRTDSEVLGNGIIDLVKMLWGVVKQSSHKIYDLLTSRTMTKDR